MSIVISPLIALMNDQVAQLENERGVKIATCINSSISYEARQQRINEIRSGRKSIVYLAPELLLATGLSTLLGERKIGLLVIDEAHIVTSWGRDFRSDYWFLGDFLKSVKKNGYAFPVLCLTATAVYTGVDDVVIGMLLDMMTIEVNENAVFEQNKSIYKIIQKRKQQKNSEMEEYIIMGNYTRLKGSMMRLLSQCYPGDDMQYCAYLPYSRDKTIDIMPMLKLLEIIGVASYDLKGGENAEIFLRVNDPEKIKRLAYSNYQNEVLKEIKRRHRRSQELLRQFFTCPMEDKKRWDFIESYFLGREEELMTYLENKNVE